MERLGLEIPEFALSRYIRVKYGWISEEEPEFVVVCQGKYTTRLSTLDLSF